MSNVTVFAGLDYHLAFVPVCVMDAGGTMLANRRCANSAAALVEAVRLHAAGARVTAAAIANRRVRWRHHQFLPLAA